MLRRLPHTPGQLARVGKRLMRSLYTAIIHVRDPLVPAVQSLIDTALGHIPGVEEVGYDPPDAVITVRFDQQLTGLADIVRLIEDAGTGVSGVAQRALRAG
jgi:copper chaperone CopZ